MSKESITVDGKYTFEVDGTGVIRVLRYGQPWIDGVDLKFTIGEKAIMALVYRAIELENATKGKST